MSTPQNRKDIMTQAQTIKAKYESDLLARRGVTGVGVGFRQKGGVFTEEVVIVVMVNKKLAQDDLDEDDRLPTELEGVSVDVQEVGRIDRK